MKELKENKNMCFENVNVEINIYFNVESSAIYDVMIDFETKDEKDYENAFINLELMPDDDFRKKDVETEYNDKKKKGLEFISLALANKNASDKIKKGLKNEYDKIWSKISKEEEKEIIDYIFKTISENEKDNKEEEIYNVCYFAKNEIVNAIDDVIDEIDENNCFVASDELEEMKEKLEKYIWNNL